MVSILVMLFQMLTVNAADHPLKGYAWDASLGGPKVYRTSQVLAADGACGNANHEVCIGLVNKNGASSKMIKCLIPKNSTTCPADLAASESACMDLDARPSSKHAPPCHYKMKENDNLASKCHCGGYGAPNDLRDNYAQCDKDMRERVSKQGESLCKKSDATQSGSSCESFCKQFKDGTWAKQLPAQCKGPFLCQNDVFVNNCKCPDGKEGKEGKCVTKVAAAPKPAPAPLKPLNDFLIPQQPNQPPTGELSSICPNGFDFAAKQCKEPSQSVLSCAYPNFLNPQNNVNCMTLDGYAFQKVDPIVLDF